MAVEDGGSAPQSQTLDRGIRVLEHLAARGTPPGSPPGSSGVGSTGAGGSGSGASGSSSPGSSGTGWSGSISGSGSGRGETMGTVKQRRPRSGADQPTTTPRSTVRRGRASVSRSARGSVS